MKPQPNFFNVAADFRPADPLPAPPNMVDLPDDPPGPVSSTLRAAARRSGRRAAEKLGLQLPPLEDADGAQGDYSPPQAVPDGRKPTAHYLPSQHIMDTLGGTPCERLEMQRVRLESGSGREWRGQPDPWRSDLGSASEASEPAPSPWATLREIGAGFGVVAFIVTMAWVFFRVVTGGGQ